MSIYVHVALQCLFVVLQFMPKFFPILDSGGLEAWHGMLASLQTILAGVAHLKFNADGTRAEVGYKKD